MTLDERGKYIVIPEVCEHKRVVVPFPAPIPKGDRLDEPNDRWPTDPAALAGECVSVDCDLLPGGARYVEPKEDDGTGEGDGCEGVR